MTIFQDFAARLTGQAERRTDWDWGRRGGGFGFTGPTSRYTLPGFTTQAQDTPLMIIAKGALAGLAGTAVITVLMAGARSLVGEDEREQPMTMYPDTETRRTEPTEEMAQRIATGVAETRLSTEQQQTYGTALHWVYGSFWGVIYGLVQSTLHLHAAVHGTLLGLTVWGVGPLSLFPTMKLTPPPTEQPMSRNALMGAMHLVYGWVTAYTFRILSSDAKE